MHDCFGGFLFRGDLFGASQSVFVATDTLFYQLIHSGFIDYAFADEPLGIQRSDAGMLFHPAVHQRLRIARLVCLVVSQATKPDHVQHDVLFIFLTVIERDAQRSIYGFRIVAVDMKDRRLGHARHVG